MYLSPPQKVRGETHRAHIAFREIFIDHRAYRHMEEVRNAVRIIDCGDGRRIWRCLYFHAEMAGDIFVLALNHVSVILEGVANKFAILCRPI